MKIFKKTLVSALVVSSLSLFGCSGASSLSTDQSNSDLPTISVTTSILADVTKNIVGDEAEVLLLMPAGSDPHNHQLSTREVSKMMSSALIIENGLGLEEGLQSSLTSAKNDGLKVLSVGEHINPLETIETEHSDHDHDHGSYDPHFWHDPTRMIEAVKIITESVMELPGVDGEAVTAQAASYENELELLDQELLNLFADIPEADRKLVTGHQVFAYLAEHYQFEVIGSIIPSSNSVAQTSASRLAEIANEIEANNVKAIFTDFSQSQKVAETVSAEVSGGVLIVPLHSESLTPAGGEADTYIKLLKINGERITDALTTNN